MKKALFNQYIFKWVILCLKTRNKICSKFMALDIRREREVYLLLVLIGWGAEDSAVPPFLIYIIAGRCSTPWCLSMCTRVVNYILVSEWNNTWLSSTVTTNCCNCKIESIVDTHKHFTLVAWCSVVYWCAKLKTTSKLLTSVNLINCVYEQTADLVHLFFSNIPQPQVHRSTLWKWIR